MWSKVFGGGLEGSARVGFKVTNCTVPAVAAAIMRYAAYSICP